MTQGPFAFIVVRPDGIGGMGSQMAIGVLQALGLGILLAFLLSKTQIATFGGRVAFVLGVVLFSSLFTDLSNWNWWQFTTSFTLVNITDSLLSWGLASLVLAKSSSPYPASSSQSS